MSSIEHIDYHSRRPEGLLSHFVENFWCLHNTSAASAQFTILPDGYFDLLWWSTDGEHFHPVLYGLATRPMEAEVPGHCTTYAISFRLPALDYIVRANIAAITDQAVPFSDPAWQLPSEATSGFDSFVSYFTQKLRTLLVAIKTMDNRKIALFDLLYANSGTTSVSALSAQVHWGARQMNRYFTSRAGISLKTYCNIVRYRASFGQLHKGTLYPEQAYFDQAHFIRDVKKYSGVTPKKLALNKNDRFIQLSTLPKR